MVVELLEKLLHLVRFHQHLKEVVLILIEELRYVLELLRLVNLISGLHESHLHQLVKYLLLIVFGVLRDDELLLVLSKLPLVGLLLEELKSIEVKFLGVELHPRVFVVFGPLRDDFFNSLIKCSHFRNRRVLVDIPELVQVVLVLIFVLFFLPLGVN